MSERDDHGAVIETGGGGAVITGVVTTVLILLGLFLIFGDQIYSNSEKVDVNGKLSKIQTPGEQ